MRSTVVIAPFLSNTNIDELRCHAILWFQRFFSKIVETIMWRVIFSSSLLSNSRKGEVESCANFLSYLGAKAQQHSSLTERLGSRRGLRNEAFFLDILAQVTKRERNR